MSGMGLNEKAGAAPTATGPDDAKSSNPASPSTTDEKATPEGETSGVVSINDSNLLNRVREYTNRVVAMWRHR